MGSCASVHKKLLLAANPPKERAAINGDDGFDAKCRPVEEQPAVPGPKNPEFGSKDEMFFESRAWLESDCEDDFYSVNGDFTPSRGSTPSHQPRTRTMVNSFHLPGDHPYPESTEPSPTGRRKLAELLQETMQREKPRDAQDSAEERTTANGEANGHKNGQLLLQSAAATQKAASEANSACSAGPTPAREASGRKHKPWDAARCCIPGFVLGFDERRQKIGPGRPCAA